MGFFSNIANLTKKSVNQLADSDINYVGGPVAPPPTGQTNFSNPSALEPRLESQTTAERIADPRLAALYFGTGTSPGFLNQLQEAARRRIQSPVPLQETAGLSDLQTLGLDRLRSGIGAFEPFLERAEQAYTTGLENITGVLPEAEQILRGTVRDFDPSMTSRFYNPFEQQVIDQAIADATKGFGLQEADVRGRDIRNVGESAFGSRANLTARERQEAFGKGLASTLASIRQSGFDTAQQRAMSEFQRRLASERGLADDLTGLGGIGSEAQIGFGSRIAGIGGTGQDLRGTEISNLINTGALPRNLQETIFSRQFARDTAERSDPLSVLTGIAQILPQYQPESTDIASAYGLAPDPSALGLGSALNAYASLYGAMGPYGSANPNYIPKTQPQTFSSLRIGDGFNPGAIYG